MERRCAGLVLAVSLLTGATAAQTREEIADAIGRLAGPREDARAIEFLIDAGEPAVGPIAEALTVAPTEIRVNPRLSVPVNPKFGRLLRVLRALGPSAADACVPLGQLVCHRRLVTPWTGRDFLGDVSLTLSQLVRFAPETVPTIQTTLLSGGTWEEILQYHVETAAGLREDASDAEEELAVLKSLDGLRLFRRLQLVDERSSAIEFEVDPSSTELLDLEFGLELLGSDGHERLSEIERVLLDANQPSTVVLPGWRIGFRLDQARANAIVWDAASKAIARIDPGHRKAVRGLALMVESADDPRDRVRAAQALGRHGEAANAYTDVLVAALDSDDDRLVAEAVTALGMIRVEDDVVVERIRVLANDRRPAIAARAKAALRALEK